MILKKLILVVIFSCVFTAQLPVHKVNGLTLYRANIINVTYVQPMFERSNVIGVQERGFLLRLQTLLTEVEEGKHPNWRSEEILIIAESYVDMNDKRKKQLNTLRELMKAYSE